MFTNAEQCPVCNTTVTDWTSRCPKCRYHPDCDDRDCYNRAQDDVASVVRYDYLTNCRPGSTNTTAWRRLVPSWLRRPGVTA